ncbi:MAG: Uncharacterised protein [Halieaceae bacterium]|nr:MAG: Uncharacterised protein [Halieaceae bacterium]
MTSLGTCLGCYCHTTAFTDVHTGLACTGVSVTRINEQIPRVLTRDMPLGDHYRGSSKRILRKYRGGVAALSNLDKCQIVSTFILNPRLRHAQPNTRNTKIVHAQPSAPWHCLYFLPLPQGQGSLRPTLGASRTTGCCVASADCADCASALGSPSDKTDASAC